MKIVSITWARNEADLLESFVRHHCALLDHMFIVLHRTDDNSEMILRALQEEGLPVTVEQSDAEHHAQSEVLTDLMRRVAADKKPEWILPLDADEFLVSGVSLHAVLLGTDPAWVQLLPWKTYIPMPGDDAIDDVRLRVTHRRLYETQQFYKTLFPGRLAADAILPLGSHTLLQASNREPWPTALPHPSLSLAHIPVRSETQLRRKIINGWETYTKNPDRIPGQLFQWETLYERCQNPRPIRAEELAEIALLYAVPDGRRVTIVPDPIIIPEGSIFTCNTVLPLPAITSRSSPRDPVRCAFICVWLGPFPVWFDFFLHSCAWNERSSDWIIFTDQPAPEMSPTNVSFVPMDMTDISRRIDHALGYTITLDSPYKLCDLKPFYGLLFYEHLQAYSHWGHCDIDIIWGDLEKFLAPAMRGGTDIVTVDSTRISGFCTVYRNEKRINTLAATMANSKDILEQKDYAFLDEWRLPQLLALHPEISVSYVFRHIEHPDGGTVLWDRGRIFIDNEERALLHMHTWSKTKKDMTIEAPDTQMKERWLINKKGIFSGELLPIVPRKIPDLSRGILIAAGPADSTDLMNLIASIRRWNSTTILVIDRGLTDDQIAALTAFPNVMRVAAEKYSVQSSLPALIESSPFDSTLLLSPHCEVLGFLDEAFVIMREHPLVSMHSGALMKGTLDEVCISAESARVLPPMHPVYNPIFHLSTDVLGFRPTVDTAILQKWKDCLERSETDENFRRAIGGEQRALLWAMQYCKRPWDIASTPVWNAVPMTDAGEELFSGNRKRGHKIVNCSWKNEAEGNDCMKVESGLQIYALSSAT